MTLFGQEMPRNVNKHFSSISDIYLLQIECLIKFHTKSLFEAAAQEGLQIYPGSGKCCWVPQIVTHDCCTSENCTHGSGKDVEGKHRPRSHEDMPCETEFANSFDDAKLDVERRINANKRRMMIMWRHAVEHTWEARPIIEICKLIDQQPKIQQETIDADDGRANV